LSATSAFPRAITSALITLGFIAAGCGGAANTSSANNPIAPTPPSLTSGGATSVYVVEHPTTGNSSILQFSAAANGAVAPSSTLTLPTGFLPGCVATDTLGQVYVGGALSSSSTTGEVLVYAAGSVGAATPTRTITGGLGVLYSPQSMVIDSSGQLYVLTGYTNVRGVVVYAANANGAATPVRTIQGSLTLFDVDGEALALDHAGTIYVATLGVSSPAGQVYAFALGLNGNVAPTRSIASTSTGSGTIWAMDTDTAGNLYVVGLANGLPVVSTIYEFSSTASGAATPIRTIAGANASLAYVRGIRIDVAGNIYIAGATTATVPYVAAFASTASGNIAPSISFTSSTFADTAIGSTSLALK
jgi:hemin uptake protein HemP